MTFLPLVERELRQATRRASTYWLRFAAVLVATLIGMGLLSPSFWGVINPTETGRNLFLAISTLALGYGLVAGVFVTADCLSEERRDGTLGLLFLSRLSRFDVVVGKLTAKSLNIFYALFAILPVLALSLLFGGVTVDEFWRVVLVLLNTLLFSLAAGMWASSWNHEARNSMAATLLAIAIVTLGPWLPVWLFGFAIGKTPFLLGSPGYAAYLVLDGNYVPAAGEFWQSVFITGALTIGLLVLATRYVRQEAHAGPGPSPLADLPKWRRQTEPKYSARWKTERAHWLAINPVLWLARREERRVNVPSICFCLAAGIGLIGWLTPTSTWQKPGLIFAVSYALNALVKLWLAAEVCRRVTDARRSGLLETLLITPLPAADILNGFLLGIKRQFILPALLVLCANLAVAALSGGASQNWLDDGVPLVMVLFTTAIFLADIYTLSWIGLWHGLTAPSQARALLRTVIQGTLVPWLVLLGFSAVLALLQGDGSPPGPGWLTVIWFIACYVTDAALCGLAINRLGDDFRTLATQPPTDRTRRSGWWFGRGSKS